MDDNALYSRLLYIDRTRDHHFIKRILELYNEGRDEETLTSIFWERSAIENWLTDKSVEGKGIAQLYKENEKGVFRLNTYKTDKVKRIWFSTLIYEDEDITINRPLSYEESKSIGLDMWNQHYLSNEQDGNDEATYFVHNALAIYPEDYSIVMVKKDGTKEILDRKGSHMCLNTFIQQIGNIAFNCLKSKANDNIAPEMIIEC